MTTAPRYRPARPEDVTAVGALARARELALHGAAELTDEELAHDWSTPGFDLAVDSWIAEHADGSLAGYADVLRSEDDLLLTVWVPTDAEAATIERSLFARCEERAAQVAAEAGEPIARLRCVTADDPARVLTLGERGYGHVRTFLRMWLDEDAAVPAAAAPSGVEIVALDRERDGAAVHAVLLEAFREHFSFGIPPDPGAWRHETLDDPRYVDGLSFAARRDGRIVGAVVGFPDGEHGWIRNIGVLPPERGSGLGIALLVAAIRAFRSRGLGAVGLGVDAENATGATRLYERAGMRLIRRMDIYERRLPAVG